MNVLKRNKKPLYHCKWYLDNNITKYYEPIPRDINYEPTNSDAQLYAFGTNYSIYLTAKVLPELGKEFKSGDKCYIYVNPPTEHDVLCKGADYIVDGEPITTINVTEIKFKRLSKKPSDNNG